MRVTIPTPLRRYTNDAREVEANGATLTEVFADLDARYPGIRFRVINEQDQIRAHIRLFVNERVAPNLDFALQPNDAVRIIMAISGG
jgi:molybdopterin synthase sulfur carrier subunit